MRDANGKSVALPIGVTNKFGYAIDFDRIARFVSITIDVEAIGERLYQLHSAAAKRGAPIKQVIFDLPYLP
jgi:penicillin-insensitive murein endopeptidase